MGSECTQAYGWVINSNKSDAGKKVYSTARFKNRFTGKYYGNGSTVYKIPANKTNVKVYDYSGNEAKSLDLAKYICCFNYKTI